MVLRIGILSGKGGVAKTTTAINLAYALSYFKSDVTLVDANFFTPDVGTFLGVAKTPVVLQDVLRNKKNINQAVYMHSSGVKIVPSSISNINIRDDQIDRLHSVLYGLDGITEYIILDSPPGLGREAQSVIAACDQAIVVVNANLPSVTDALKTIKVIQSKGKIVLGVIVARTHDDQTELKIKNIQTMLEYPILGIIPEDQKVRESLLKRQIITKENPRSRVAIEYKKIASKILQEKYNENPEEEKFTYKFLKKLRIKR